MIVMSVIFTVLHATGFDYKEFKIAFYCYESIVVDGSILVGYYLIFKRVKAYHEDLIEYSGLDEK